jgi:multiple sugar transport system substrate-binding protein
MTDLYTREGELFALPRDFDTVGLWYNKALFDAAGVEYPNADWTWNDLRAAAQKLTIPDQGVYGIAAWLTDQQGYYNTIAQAGGNVVSPDGAQSGYDDPNSIEGLRFWTDLIKEGVSPTHRQMIDTEPKQMFQSGNVAMFYGGSWQAVSLASTPPLADSLGVAPLPAGEEDTTIIHGLGNAINANTACAEEAWEFVKFLSSQEAAETMAASGIVIPAYEGSQQGWLDAFPQLDLQTAFLDQVDQATPFPVSENTAEWQALEKEMLPAAWTGERPVDEVARDLAAAMDSVLAESQ